MATKDLCIELARRDSRWRSGDPAVWAALAVMQDLDDRRGFRFDDVDPEVQAEIIEDWAAIIRDLHKGE